MRLLYGDEWRDHDFTGERVAVVAPGDLAARIVPEVVRTARSVKVFQQEPTWVAPLRLPVLRTRLAKLHLRLTVGDAWTRRLLTPGRFGRRDVTVSQRYYRALQQPNCKLVGWPVYAIAADGVRSAEGIEHRVDTVVLPHSMRLATAA